VRVDAGIANVSQLPIKHKFSLAQFSKLRKILDKSRGRRKAHEPVVLDEPDYVLFKATPYINDGYGGIDLHEASNLARVRHKNIRWLHLCFEDFRRDARFAEVFAYREFEILVLYTLNKFRKPAQPK
jgi:hypothetical protein